jgi:CRP/FNR family transcriptional regulator, cyclic AMP receptor protein
METSKTVALSRILAGHPFLKDLKPGHLQFMAEHASQLQFAAGEYILCAGEVATDLYLIDRGKVALGTVIPGRGFTTIEILEDGAPLGWSWLVPPYHWHFTALAVLPTRVFALEAEHLREKCEADHDFGYELVKRLALILGQRLRMTRKQLV